MPSPLQSTTITTFFSADNNTTQLDSFDNKVRGPRGQDVLRKQQQQQPAKAIVDVKRSGLGQGASWNRQEDMDYEDGGKENNGPPLPVTLDLSPVKKPRKCGSRSSLARQASLDTLNSAFPSLALTSPPLTPPALPPLLSPISESDLDDDECDFDYFQPMQPLSSTSHDDNDLFNFNFNLFGTEFRSPGADDWTMEETEDGCLRFVNKDLAPQEDCIVTSASFTIIVERCVW